MKQFWTIVKDYMRRQKRLFVVSLVLYLITALLAMLPAKILQLTIDVGFMRSDVQALVLCIVALLLTHAIKSLLTYLSNKGMISFGNGLLKRVKSVIYDCLMEKDLSFYSENEIGYINARVEEIDSIDTLFSSTSLSVLSAVLEFVFASIILFSINWKVLLVLCIPIPALILISVSAAKKMAKQIKESLDSNAEYAGKIQDSLRGMETVKSQGLEEYENIKSELEEANAVFYSNDEELHNTAIDLGSKMAASSSFIVRPPKLSRITLQFNDKCNLNCRKCGEVTCFPCMSCSAANTNRVISQEQVIGFFVYLSTFGLPDLHILGGDPLMDYTLLQHVVSAYKQLAPEGNIWVYTNAVSLIEYSNEELDFIKNNVNILLILCEENLLRMDSIINVMHKSQIRFEVQSRDLMQEFDESVLCNNTIDFIQKNKLPIVSHLNMKRNVTLYSNTNAGIRNQCYDGRIFISLDGSVGVCKQYLLPLSIINNKSWADIIHQLAKMWKKTFTSPVCENCGLSALCISCQRLHELYLKQSTEFPRAICFTQQSGKNKHRKEEEIHA